MGLFTNTVLLAAEGVEGLPAEHIASKLAVPIGILIFCGSIYLLLWSNYGAKKGALIYSTAFFGFSFLLGVFWWFGAPGTPVATGLQNFPGQPADQYQQHWYPIEPGSEAASELGVPESPASMQPIEEFLGQSEGPKYNSVVGDLATARELMVNLAIRNEDGQSLLGGQERAAYLATAEEALQAQVDDPENWVRANPTYTGEASDVLMDRFDGTLTAGTEVTVSVNYVQQIDGDLTGESLAVPVDTKTMFAFKQESILWFPSMIWTVVSFVVFVASLFGLDRMEQRERKREEEIDEPESLAVPIRQ